MTSFTVKTSVETQGVVEGLQEHRRSVFLKLKPHVFRIVIEYPGNVEKKASGFRPYRDHQIVVSAGHINDAIPVDPNSARVRPSKFYALYDDGHKIELALEKFSNAPDLAILKPVAGSMLHDVPSNLVGGHGTYGDDVYILGCKGLSATASFSCTHGIISGLAYNGADVSLTAHSDNGISGGLVANCRGEMVGVLVGGEGTTILLSRMVYVKDLEAFIREYFLPPPNQTLPPSFSPAPMEG